MVSEAANVRPGLDPSEAVRVRPRIGLAGSFGRGNYGDELYVKTYEHWFGGWADLFMLAGLPSPAYFRAYADAAVGVTDAVVVGGGDLICPYAPRVSRDFVNPAYLRRPTHVLGIGVQLNRPDSSPEVLEKWQSFLGNPAIESISTRDPGSRDWIEKTFDLGVPVSSHPDLVCALPLPLVSPPAGAPIVGVVTRHVQPGSNYAQLAVVLAGLKARGWRVRHIIGGVGPHGQKDLENSKLLDVPGKELVHTEDLDEISIALGECTLVLSMKLHTTIVSTMYGVPTVSVNPVVKAREFMRAAGQEEFVVGPLDSRLQTLVEAGVRAPSQEVIMRLRDEAGAAIRGVGQRIWDGFRSGSSVRALLPLSPSWPE